MDYKLEIKQIVKFPRVRIHRELIHKLMSDRRLSMRGTSHLIQYMILCSYANYRRSRRMIDGTSHIIYAGQWLCRIQELQLWLRLKNRQKVEELLDSLVQKDLITYHYLSGNKMILYQITGWKQFNTILDYECRCRKDSGFFFFPVSYAARLLEGKRASELDVIMDLWLHAIYMDERVSGSELGPVVYYRTQTGDPTTNYMLLGERWGLSKATVSRLLHKLEDLGHLKCLHFSGNRGSVIYLEQYLSTMFNICDVPVDKDEVSFALNIRVRVETSQTPTGVAEPVSNTGAPVSKQIARVLAAKVLQTLAAQGFACCSCERNSVQISLLSDCPGFILEVSCKKSIASQSFRFEIRIRDASG